MKTTERSPAKRVVRPQAPLPRKPFGGNQPREEDDIAIDTSKMNKGKAAAMEVAESARQSNWNQPGFVHDLFMGTFRPEMLTPFPLQSEQEKKIGDEMIQKVSDFLSKNLDPETVDEQREIPQHVIDGLKELGLFAMKIPKEYDGLGLSQVNYNRIMAAITSYCGSTAVLLSAHQSIGAPQPIKLCGTPEQKLKYLPLFRQGKISAFALTEPDVGSDPARMTTHAEISEDGTHYILNGEKLWCTNGLTADIIVVMAKTKPIIKHGKERQQITAFIVERSMPGIEIVHRCDLMGIRGIRIGVLRFKDVKVPVENVLMGEGKGLKLALTTLNTGRLTLPAACTGMARQCLSIVRRWSNKRVQWGSPIGRHQAIAAKIAFIAETTFAMEALTHLASHWADRGDVDIRLEAAMAKMFCSEMAWKIVDETMQIRGGSGYEKMASLKERGVDAYPVERMMRECRINMIIEGTSEIMRLFLAREALDAHLKLASDFIKRGVPIHRKILALAKMGLFYCWWYPTRWIHWGLINPHAGMGPMAKYFRYIDRTAHKLARTMFLYVGLYQAKLEKKQLLLARLMEIGTELFAMAATCSYAHELVKKDPSNSAPYAMADSFCRSSQRRILDRFTGLSHNDDNQKTRLSRKVLDGSMRWMENDIIWIGPKD